MMPLRSIVAYFVAAVFLAFCLGCGGDGIKRCVVTGTIQFEGAPISNGEIRFVPDEGPISGGPIIDGKYEIKHKGGVPVGKHTVRVTAYTIDASDARRDERDIAEIGTGTEFQYIPEMYNEKSTLRAEIGGQNPQTLDFDLEKRGE